MASTKEKPMPLDFPAALHRAVDSLAHPEAFVDWDQCGESYRDDVRKEALHLWANYFQGAPDGRS